MRSSPKQQKIQAFTPKKTLNNNSLFSNHKKQAITTTSVKDFLPPILQNVNVLINIPSFTPLKKQPQYLLSPSPIKKDLFSQLLGSQLKNNSPGFNHMLGASNSMISEEEEDYEAYDDENNREKGQNNDENGFNSNDEDSDIVSDSQNCWDDENGIKKRKRKSTAQIKILKQQLDGQMNWTKQKIVKMAQVTGLSQSQVYKWCWDQKKKNLKHKEKQGSLNKRKFIKKDYSSRQFKQFKEFQAQNYSNKQNCEQQVKPINIKNGSSDYSIYLKKQFGYHNISQTEQLERQVRTKPKIITMAMIQQCGIMATEKKVNKKLIFN